MLYMLNLRAHTWNEVDQLEAYLIFQLRDN